MNVFFIVFIETALLFQLIGQESTDLEPCKIEAIQHIHPAAQHT